MKVSGRALPYLHEALGSIPSTVKNNNNNNNNNNNKEGDQKP